MSYDLLAFAADVAPDDDTAFARWFEEQAQWSEEHSYSDATVTTPQLRAFYHDLIATFPPLNGPDAPDLDHDDPGPVLTDYSIGYSIVYAGFRWTVAGEARETFLRLAARHRVGVCDFSHTPPLIYRPMTSGAPYTHVVEFDGGPYTAGLGSGVDMADFGRLVGKLDGVRRWGLVLSTLPNPVDSDDLFTHSAGCTEFLMAGGRSDALTLQIRKPVISGDGAVSVLSFIGHPHDGNPPADVPIQIGAGTERVTAAEVFGTEEAAALFDTYYRTGEIPEDYALRPLLGWTADGALLEYPR